MKVQDNDKRETQKTRATKLRKCRYFNRGFCKYGVNCKFYHSPDICNDYLEEGICRKNYCTERHPKVCKYWGGNQNGCSRDSSTCQYLHVVIGKDADSKDKNGTLNMNDEGHNEDVNVSCDQCVCASNKKHDLVAQTKSLHRDVHYYEKGNNSMDSNASEDDVEYGTDNESFDLNRLNEEDVKKIVDGYEKRYCEC